VARTERAAASACHPQNDRRHARALKLKDRGLLREGFCADVVLFDPDDFTDRATYADPHQFPSGARTTVIVNGTPVVENATHTGALPGKVLRRDGAGAVA
jgi:N-acyl-D-amino-acid deacylase